MPAGARGPARSAALVTQLQGEVDSEGRSEPRNTYESVHAARDHALSRRAEPPFGPALELPREPEEGHGETDESRNENETERATHEAYPRFGRSQRSASATEIPLRLA